MCHSDVAKWSARGIAAQTADIEKKSLKKDWRNPESCAAIRSACSIKQVPTDPIWKKIGIGNSCLGEYSGDGLEGFLAVTVFFHEFVQLAGGNAGLLGRSIDAPPVACEQIFQIAPFDLLNPFRPNLRQGM